MPDPIRSDDAHALAKMIAAKIVSGELPAYEGGRRIWKEVINQPGQKCPDDLWPFKANASAIEDIQWNAQQGGRNHAKLIQQCEQEIMVAANQLINQP